MIIPVITLWRPWCFMIEEGWKTIETRLHNKLACLKGQTIGIHVGKKWDNNWLASIHANSLQIGLLSETINDDRIGQIICQAYVQEFKHLDSRHSEYAMIDCVYASRYGLFLKDIKKIETPKFSESQGVWYYDTEKQIKVTVKYFREQQSKELYNMASNLFADMIITGKPITTDLVIQKIDKLLVDLN